jgi:hypothetical protein
MYLSWIDILFFIIIICVLWYCFKAETFGDGLSYNGIMWGESKSIHDRNDVEPKQVSMNSLPPNTDNGSKMHNTVDYGIRRQFSTYDDAMTNMTMSRNKAQRTAHLNKHTLNLQLAKDLFEDELAKNENRDWFTNWDDNSLVRPGEVIPTPYTPYSQLRL